MSDLKTLWKEIKDEVAKADVDVEKQINGNKAAGARVRKSSLFLRNKLKELKSTSMAISKGE